MSTTDNYYHFRNIAPCYLYCLRRQTRQHTGVIPEKFLGRLQLPCNRDQGSNAPFQEKCFGHFLNPVASVRGNSYNIFRWLFLTLFLNSSKVNFKNMRCIYFCTQEPPLATIAALCFDGRFSHSFCMTFYVQKYSKREGTLPGVYKGMGIDARIGKQPLKSEASCRHIVRRILSR